MCSWCGKDYKVGDDVIDRMDWCTTEQAWAVWNGETIHRNCDYDRYDYEMREMEGKMKQTKITDYFCIS
jgi:hypothetical protein